MAQAISGLRTTIEEFPIGDSGAVLRGSDL
jgi:hypothetical protein